MPGRLIQTCRSNEGWQPIDVPSHSDPDLTYTVFTSSLLAPREFVCECEGFKFRQRCSHQLEASAKICGWNQLDSNEQQTDHQRQKLICPRCGELTRRVMEEQ